MAGIVSSFARSFEFLLVTRALVGFGIGSITVSFDLLAEFLPNKNRGQFLIIIGIFWTIGSIIVGVVAWLVLNQYGWRMVTLITSVPVTISCIIALIMLPESPRWLHIMGRTSEAEDILNDVLNTNNHRQHIFVSLTPPPSPSLDEDINSDNEIDNDSLHSRWSDDTSINNHKEQTSNWPRNRYCDLVRPPIRGVFGPLCLVWGCFGFCYYAVILLVSRVNESHHTDGVSLSTEVLSLGSGHTTCDYNYLAILASAGSEVMGTVFSLYTVDRWGRVRTQVVLYSLSAISVLFMSLQGHAFLVSAISMIARCAASAASMATWVATPELFSTRHRGTAHSVANSIARVGAFLSPFLVQSHEYSVTVCCVVIAVLNVVAAGNVLLLPETGGRHLDEVSSVQT